jgi:hypothetical protein
MENNYMRNYCIKARINDDKTHSFIVYAKSEEDAIAQFKEMIIVDEYGNEVKTFRTIQSVE